ncbi:hypothetical protein C8J98_104155 [Luteibacter sp. OK325]|nr:hypothetical protein C8J98_104155 [Luteibacter sp. OK325]
MIENIIFILHTSHIYRTEIVVPWGIKSRTVHTGKKVCAVRDAVGNLILATSRTVVLTY